MWKLGRFFLRSFVFGWVVFSFVFTPFATHATITSLVSYQAKLTDTNNVAIADAAYTIKFRIYAVSSGGTALYAEQQSVTTANGLFSALIGSGTLIESSGALSTVDFNQDPLYLGVQVGSDAEMTPRKRIAASIFAFNANKVGGKSETEFALLAGRAGGQVLTGGNAATENLTLQSTASSTKGKIFFGANSAYDEANIRFAIGATSSASRLDLYHATSTSNLDVFRILTDVGGVSNVKFRVDSDGDIFTDGSTTIGTPADFAENYIGISDTLQAGDIVSLSGETLGVDKSGVAYDKKMLGVISFKPGIILAGDLEKGVPVALSGRVPVHVSLENGPIYVGDPITSSNVPGVGMKATKTGKIIGYALEDYAEAKDINTILVFVNLGYHLADDAFSGVSSSESGVGADFVSSLRQALAAFTGIVKTAGTWIFDAIETTFLGVKHLTVENGITIKDKVTGEYYCMTVQNGAVISEKGACDTSELSVSVASVASSSPAVSSEDSLVGSEQASSSPEIVSETASSTTE